MTPAIDIRSLRRNRGLLLKEVADVVEVTESAMSMYERGERTPNNRIAKRIADFYGYTVTDLWPDPASAPEPEDLVA